MDFALVAGQPLPAVSCFFGGRQLRILEPGGYYMSEFLV